MKKKKESAPLESAVAESAATGHVSAAPPESSATEPCAFRGELADFALREQGSEPPVQGASGYEPESAAPPESSAAESGEPELKMHYAKWGRKVVKHRYPDGRYSKVTPEGVPLPQESPPRKPRDNTRGRPSRIRRLPRELREQINEMLGSGHTGREISEHLRKLGHGISATCVWRYARSQEKILQSLRRSREAADAIVGRIGAGADEGRIGRALTQIVQTLAFDYINRRSDDAEGELELDEILKLARAIRAATMTGRAGQDHETRTRQTLREQEEREESSAPVSVVFGGGL